MGEVYFFFLIMIVMIAAILGEDFVLVILYLIVGAFIFGKWWSQKALDQISIKKFFPQRAFLGEKITVRLAIVNSSWLPLVWLRIRENLPVEVRALGTFQQVISLRPKGAIQLEYPLECRKRGYYPIGPTDLFSGDIFGLEKTKKRQEDPEYLVVFPKVVMLKKINITSQAPLGTLRHTQPIFEDPSRVLGKRNYMVGDSFRRIDWKATAAVGSLQIKLFEPSIALETAIFLSLNTGEFNLKTRYDISELAIVVAASIANWIIGIRQSVGLFTNGIDPMCEGRVPPPIPPHYGRAHLLRILETLARIQVSDTFSVVQLLRQSAKNLSWGTTILLITRSINDDLFDCLFQIQRSGLNVLIIPCGPISGFSDLKRKAEYFGFSFYQVLNEQDLEAWR